MSKYHSAETCKWPGNEGVKHADTELVTTPTYLFCLLYGTCPQTGYTAFSVSDETTNKVSWHRL